MVHCLKCGAEIGADWSFCNRCGTCVGQAYPDTTPEKPTKDDLRRFARQEAEKARQQARAQRGRDARKISLDEVAYAVVDVETTGINPVSHRICEVAVVCLDSEGRFEREYVTLVNPRRDMGMTPDIHQITPAMAGTAPPFEEVADDLLDFLTGRVLVAHKADFDHGFLDEEFARAGVFLPYQSVVCTMELLTRLAVRGIRSLEYLCATFGVPLHDNHMAKADARGCAQAFQRMLELGRGGGAWKTLADLGTDYGPAPSSAWPKLAREETVWTRDDALQAVAELPRLPNHGFTRDQILSSCVCLTGDFLAGEREEIELHLKRLGITIKSAMSRKVDFLVAADPYSLSSKAAKARELGKPILDEETFWSILGAPWLVRLPELS